MEEPIPQHAGGGVCAKLPALRQAPAQQTDVWTKGTNGKTKFLSSHNTVQGRDLVVGKKKGKNGKGLWVVRDQPMEKQRFRERIPKQINAFNMKQYGQGNTNHSKQQDLLEKWMTNYQTEQVAFSSVATWAEVVLRRVLADTAHLNRPNPLRTAVCCMLLDRVSALFGRYEGLLTRLTDEIFASIYHDWPTNTEFKKPADQLPTLLPLPSHPIKPHSLAPLNRAESFSSSVAPSDQPEESSVPGDDAFSEPEPEQRHLKSPRKAVHELNNMSSYFQVCRQLVFSQDSALTVDRGGQNSMSITDVLNAAISRWQRSILRIYFLNWRMVGRKERSRKERVRGIAERLFLKKLLVLKKKCFSEWKEVAQNRKTRVTRECEDIRAKAINTKMAKKLLELEASWQETQSKMEYFRSEYHKCKSILLKMSGLLRKFREASGKEEATDDPEPEENDDSQNDTTRLGEAKEDPLEKSFNPQITNDDKDPTEQNDEPTSKNSTHPLDAKTIKQSIDAMDARITDAVKSKGPPLDKVMDTLLSNDEAIRKKAHGHQTSPTKLFDQQQHVKDGETVKQRTPFTEVLRWVNTQVHSLITPYKKITNFVTDFRNCHNYGYLLQSLIDEDTEVPVRQIAELCLDASLEDSKKAVAVLQVAQSLLGTSLEGIMKPSDILKMKASKNSSLVYKLFEKFSTSSKIARALQNPTSTIVQNKPDTDPDDASLDLDGFDSQASEPVSKDNKGKTSNIEPEPTNDDYDRWLMEYPDEDDIAPDTRSPTSVQLDRENTILSRSVTPIVNPDGDQPKENTPPLAHSLRQHRHVTLGDILQGTDPGSLVILKNSEPSPKSNDERHPLLKWFNKQLTEGGCGGVKNFADDLKDFKKYAEVLALQSPNRCPSLLTVTDVAERRRLVGQVLGSFGVFPKLPDTGETDCDLRRAHMTFMVLFHSVLTTAVQNSLVILGTQVIPTETEICEALKISKDNPSDTKEILATLERNAVVLQKVFLIYSCAQGCDLVMGKTEWNAFCKGCGLHDAGIRFPVGAKKPLVEATKGVLRAAQSRIAAFNTTALEAVRALIEDVIIPKAPLEELIAFHASLDLPDISGTLKPIAQELKKIFRCHATRDRKGDFVVSWAAFLTFLINAKLLSPTLNPKAAFVVFASVQTDLAGLTFLEFLKALCSLATLRDPMPFHSLRFQVERFMKMIVAEAA